MQGKKLFLDQEVKPDRLDYRINNPNTNAVLVPVPYIIACQPPLFDAVPRRTVDQPPC